jgi:hypothetical protein
MAQIRHIELSSDDTENLDRVYKKVFGFRYRQKIPGRSMECETKLLPDKNWTTIRIDTVRTGGNQ